MGNKYSPGMGAAGWEILTDEEKRAWWGQADEFSKDHLRAALEESRVEPKKLGAPHALGDYRSREAVKSLKEVVPLEPGVVPIDVQRPTEKIMTGPQRQAMELEVLGTPGREPTIPPPDVAARDAELFGVGELDVAMDQAMAGGILRDELVQYGDEFEGIYQYFKSRGVPEDKITKFWRRTINEMGDFEGKTLWGTERVEGEGLQDLINADTGEVVRAGKDKKSHWKIVQQDYTGSQPTEERAIREAEQELIDGGMHPADAEVHVREKGVRMRTPEQQAFAIDEPLVVGKAWQAKPGTPAYDMVTDKAAEWADRHGTHRVPTGADDPRSRASTEHPRFTELHKKRLAGLRAATQAEAKIGQSIALDPITGEPGFPGQKFFHAPGDFPVPDPPLGRKNRPSGMEQFLRDTNAANYPPGHFTGPPGLSSVDPLTPAERAQFDLDYPAMQWREDPNIVDVPGAGGTAMADPDDLFKRRSLLERLSQESRGPLPDLTNLPDDELRAIGNDILSRKERGAGTFSDAMDLQEVVAEVRRRDLIKAGEGRITYPQPYPGIEDDPRSIANAAWDEEIAAGQPNVDAARRHARLKQADIAAKASLVPGSAEEMAFVLGEYGEIKVKLEAIDEILGLPQVSGGVDRAAIWRPLSELSDVELELLRQRELLSRRMRHLGFLREVEFARAGSDGMLEAIAEAREYRKLYLRNIQPTEQAIIVELLSKHEPWLDSLPHSPETAFPKTPQFTDSLLERNARGDFDMPIRQSAGEQPSLPGRSPTKPPPAASPRLFPEDQIIPGEPGKFLRQDLDPLTGEIRTVPKGLHYAPEDQPSLPGMGEPTELTGPGELTAAEDQALRLQAKEQEAIQQADWERLQVESAPPKVKVGDRWVLPGGTDDLFPNSKPLNDAVNEWIAGGMTEEGLDDLAKKANDPKNKWLKDLNEFLEGQGKPRRAKKSAAMRDIADIVTGDVSLAEAATTPRTWTRGEFLTDEEIHNARESARLEGEADVLHNLEGSELDKIIQEGDLGDLARQQEAAAEQLPQQTYGPEDYADNTLEPSTAEMRQAQGEARALTGFEDMADAGPTVEAAPVETAAQALTNKQHAIVKRELDFMVDEGVMSAGERTKHLDDLLKGETRIMERMTVAQQKSLLRLMGETRTGHWADYPTRNAAYKKLLSSNTLGAWELTKQLVQANPSFRLSMKEAVGWGMTAAERKAAGRGLITLGKNITGKTTIRGMNIAGRAGKIITGPIGLAEMIVAGGQELDELNRGAGQTLMGGFRKPTPLKVNVADLDAEVARRLADPGNNFPWTRPHVLLEIAVSHNLIPDKDARELVAILDGLMGLNPKSDKTKQIANNFNKKLAALLENPAYEYGRLIDVVEDLPFQTKTDWVNRVPILNWFTRPYLTAGAGGAEAPWWINWAKNPRSQSRSVEQVKIKATYANAIRSGHIPVELAVMIAPEMRYQRVKKDEGLGALNWRLMERVPIEHGGVPHVRKDVLHGILTEKPPGWVEGDPLGTLKISKEQAEEMMRHPQGRKLAADMQSGKIIPINPDTSLPYRPRDYAGGLGRNSPHRPTFDPNVGTPPPDYKWIQASDKYEDTFLTTLGYDSSIPTWREYDQWKAMRLGSEMKPGFIQPQFKQVEGGLNEGEFRAMQEAMQLSTTPWGHFKSRDFGQTNYTKFHFFEEFEDILDEMRASGVGISEDGKGVETYRTNVSRRQIPNPLVPMFTGQEVKDGVQQKPRYSFTNDFDKSSRAYETHKGIRQILPHTDPSYFTGGRELLKTGGGRY